MPLAARPGSFRELLSAFAADLGLGEIDLDDESYFCFGLGEDGRRVLHLRFDAGADAVLLLLDLGTVPAADRAEVSADLLRGNVALVGSRGGALGLNPATGVVSLARRERLTGYDNAAFRALIEEFLEAAADWTAVVNRAAPDGADGTGAAGADGTADPFNPFALRI